MPTYEYECRNCGHRFEIFQNIKDEPLKSCPKCNKTLNRVIGSGSGIIFSRRRRDSAEAEKGSGFYAKEQIPCPKIKEGCRGCS